MGSKISHKLNDLGFFSALGTTEHGGMQAKGHLVKRGTPKTYDYNNGTHVVYDEKGRPWIISRSSLSGIQETAFQELIVADDLQHGAHVPHSNDSGHFVREVIPEL